MTDNKPPMFGPSFVIDPANHKPRSGKSALMNQMMAELAGKANLVETIIGNCSLCLGATRRGGGVPDRLRRSQCQVVHP